MLVIASQFEIRCKSPFKDLSHLGDQRQRSRNARKKY